MNTITLYIALENGGRTQLLLPGKVVTKLLVLPSSFRRLFSRHEVVSIVLRYPIQSLLYYIFIPTLLS